MSRGLPVPSAGPPSGAVRARVPARATPHRLSWGERYAHYWLLLPATIAMAGVLVYPMIFSLWVSLHDWPLVSQDARWVGLGNYLDAVTTPFFRFVLVQSVAFMLVCLVLEFILGLALALLLTLNFPGRRILRTIFLLPMLVAPALTGFNFRWIFNDRFGLANQLLILTGLGQPLPWLSDTTLARIAIVASTVWSGTPFFMLLLLAGLQSLPLTPFEAATVDGANVWQRFWHITLPLLRPVIAVAAALQVIDLFRVFDTIYVMTMGGPAHATELFPFYTWRSAFSENRAGFASALSYIILAITALFLIPVLRAEHNAAEASK
jgi:multiple sugar transport system permease protein